MADNAQVYITDLLAQYGLSSLSDWAWGQLTAGASPEQVVQSLRQQPAYAARFPAAAALAQKGMAMSEAEMLSYEQTATQMMRAAGLPSGFYDSPQDFGTFMSNEVSVGELQQRVSQAQEAAVTLNSDVRQQFQDFYGIGPGDLTAYFLDPDVAEPLLKQRYAAAQTSATAARTGYGTLGVLEAEQVGNRVQSQQEAQQGFTTLAHEQELFNPLTAGEQAIGRQQQLAAAFSGDANAQSEIEKQAARRAAQFGGGGQFAGTNAGLAVGSTTR